MSRRFWWLLSAVVCVCCALPAQVIDFESGGLRYQTLSRSGVTIMFAHMPVQVREYTIVQATVSNGSSAVCTIRPEDFAFRFPDGHEMRAQGAPTVVDEFLRNAGRNDVIRLVKLLRDMNDIKGPKLLHIHTVKGKGVSFMENNPKFHGMAPTPAEVEIALKELQ